MNILSIAGCRADNLAGYLKAVGVLRLVAGQFDATARAAWTDGRLALVTELSLEQLLDAFLDDYQPTPVLNPWNSGAGFDAKSKPTQGRSFTTILATTGPRFEEYRAAILAADAAVSGNQRGAETDKSAAKKRLLETLRRRYSDAALEWLDAAVIAGCTREEESLAYPPILGTGGNDGRLDFAVNFAGRVLDVIGPKRDRTQNRSLLEAALLGTHDAKLHRDLAIGQYSPLNAGGSNGGNGFEAFSLVNAWEYVLIIEGAICFSAAAGRRFPLSARTPTAPFSFQGATTAGYASASAAEPIRAELWLPRWTGAASFDSVRAMLRAGRLEINLTDDHRTGVRQANSALEAAHAAISYGTSHGIDQFQRVLLAERNGRSYVAAPVGEVIVRGDAGVAALSREAVLWLSRLRPDKLGASARIALDRYARAILSYGRSSDLRERRLQEVIAAIGELDRLISTTTPEKLSPLPFLPNVLLKHLDDGSPEHDLARAICATGIGTENIAKRIRFNLSNIVMGSDKRLKYARSVENLWMPGHPIRSLALVAERRARFGEPRVALSSRLCGASIVNLQRFADRRIDVPRLAALVVAYALIEPASAVPPAETTKEVCDAPLAALRIMVDGIIVHRNEQTVAFDPSIISQLAARRTRPALETLYRKLQAADFAPRDFRNVQIDAESYAAAAAIPINPVERWKLPHYISRASLDTRDEMHRSKREE